jgi:hypothetical protein
MKAAASEVGIDPALVERAARLLQASSSSTSYERLVGGPALHDGRMRLPVTLDEARAAQLLASIRILAEEPGTGHSSPEGVVWHGGNEMETLRITARPVAGGTAVALHVDRTGILTFLHIAGGIGSLLMAAGGMVLGDQVGPVVGVAAGVGGIGGIIALSRAYWTSSTREIRKRVDDLMDAIGEAAVRHAGPPPPGAAVTDDPPRE